MFNVEHSIPVYDHTEVFVHPQDTKCIVIIVRHGKFLNPSGLLYNRDSVMDRKDWVHLSKEGEEQMQALAGIIKSHKFQVTTIWTSPTSRAKESAVILAQTLGVTDVQTNDILDDVLSPTPYRQHMTMAQLEKLHGDVYSLAEETPQAVAARMKQTLVMMAEHLHQGETGVLMSHGDPTAWLLRDIIQGALPSPENLRDALYLPKAGAVAVFLSHNQIPLAVHFLTNLNEKTY
ncbi:MAG: histidine phosphatase family protein [Candidatus Gottesmanbacteria bacterium]|nr:histidine phosphatase family protein [Candidatus Gottesmanbacteria bacterium]